MPQKMKEKINQQNTSKSSDPQGGLVRRVCLSYSRKKSLIRSFTGYKDEQSLNRNLKIFFPSSKNSSLSYKIPEKHKWPISLQDSKQNTL